MNKAGIHNLRIKSQRNEIIEDIKLEMRANKTQELDLTRGIIFNYVDSEPYEYISGVTLDERVFIDVISGEMDTISLSDLSTEHLVTLLDMIENKQFRVIEEYD